MVATIEVPKQIRDGSLVCFLSMSGGKDSTAAGLALREAGVKFRMVFADTGWEAKATYEHLDHLREKMGPIDVVGVPGGMIAKVKERFGFPARMQRWCTRELKLKPLREYHDRCEASEGIETVCVMGVRAAESKSRAEMLKQPLFFDEPEGDKSWGGYVWRPILKWTVEDVLAIDHRHGVSVNPLYKQGHGRVGCYPCIFASKEQVRLLAEHSPERIDEMRALEAEMQALREAANRETPGRFEDPRATFFRSSSSATAASRPSTTWCCGRARTTAAASSPLLPPAPTEGCARWGMCEPPTEDADDSVEAEDEGDGEQLAVAALP